MVPEPGTPKSQHRHESSAGGCIIAGLRGGHAARIALAELVVFLDQRFFGHVGEEAAKRRACPRQHAGNKTDHGRAQHGDEASADVAKRDGQLVELDADRRTLAVALDEDEDFGDSEQADDRDQKIDAVHQMQIAKGETWHAARIVEPDHRDREADAGGDGGFRLILRCHAAKGAEGQHVECEIFRRSEQKGNPCQERRQQHQPDGRQHRTDEGRHAREHQGVARPTGLGHGIAVERGHQRRLVARNVQEDRGNAPAIHRSVIDAGHQDQGFGGVKA